MSFAWLKLGVCVLVGIFLIGNISALWGFDNPKLPKIQEEIIISGNGTVGPAGPAGPPGADGADGINGTDGIDGINGTVDYSNVALTNQSNSFIGNQTTSSWWNGLFNWTIIGGWFNWNGATLSFNETKLNTTIGQYVSNLSSSSGTGLWATNGTSIYNSTVSQVGINTSTPQEMLDVRGNVKIGTNGASRTLFMAGSEYNDNPKIVFGSQNGYNITMSRKNDYLTFEDKNGNPAMRISITGKVGFPSSLSESSFTFTSLGNTVDGMMIQSQYAYNQIAPLFKIREGSTAENGSMFEIVSRTNVSKIVMKGGHDSYRIGILENNPQQQLVVVGDVNFTADEYLGDDLLIVGDVGIGTNTPTHPLNVIGSGNITGDLMVQSQNVTKWLYNQTNLGGGSLWVTNGTSIYNETVLQVGIGTATPKAKLHIEGGGFPLSNIRFNNSGFGSAYYEIGVREPTQNNDYFSIEANGSNIASFRSNGYVGVGTSTPGARFDVNGGDLWVGNTANAAQSLIWRRNGATIGGIGTQNSKFNMWGGATVANHLIIDSAGNIGLGTISPTHTLHVYGNTNLSGNLWAGNGTLFVNSTSVGVGTNTPKYLLTIANSAIAMNVSGMLYANSSSVGIGTTTPTKQLHIIGNTNMTGNLSVEGIIKAKNYTSSDGSYGTTGPAGATIWSICKATQPGYICTDASCVGTASVQYCSSWGAITVKDGLIVSVG